MQNILARVTSGSPSSIDGTIRSDIQGANLFFMNPAGVLFGRHAQLDVSGSFAVTTANYLKLVGGGRFNANLGGGDVLTSAPVSAFGFLNNAPAPVSVTGSTLNVASQKVFSAVAGDITLSGGKISGEGSRVNLMSVKSPGEVQLDATNMNSAVDVSQFTVMGTIDLTNFAQIDTSGLMLERAGGPMVIRGGHLKLHGGQISSNTSGSSQGGTVDIDIAGEIELTDGGFIETDTIGSGKGGDVTLHAGSLSIDGDSSIFADTDLTGHGGNLTITVDKLLSIVGFEQQNFRRYVFEW